MKKVQLISTVLIALACAYPFLLPAQTLDLEYSTYLGGSDLEEGYDIAVDTDLCAYLVGETYSSDFPTVDCYQASHTNLGYYATYVTKFSSSGSSLIYSTYLGGGMGFGIILDSNNCAYVTGTTDVQDFPTKNAYQTSKDGDKHNAFVTKFSSSGTSLIYSTYLGGASTVSLGNEGYDIAVDSVLCAYVTGYTQSSSFPTLNPYQPSHAGNRDVFVTKFSSSGSSLIYSTYLGGGSNDIGYGIVLDSFSNAYIGGSAGSGGFPTVNPYQSNYGGDSRDSFVTKFSSTGSSLLYSTYLGGGGDEAVEAIAVDSTFCAYLAGCGDSQNFPTTNPYQSSNAGGNDGLVTKFSSSGTSLIYSTYLGGSSDDECYDINLDSQNRVYVCGGVWSSDFPTLNPYQTSNAGPIDGFVTKFSSSGSSLIYSTYFGGGVGGDVDDWITSLRLDSNLDVYIAGYACSLDFPTRNSYQTTNNGSSDGFTAKLKNFTTPTPTPTVTPTPSPSPSAPILDEGFDNYHLGTRPAGWTFVNCNSNSDTYTTGGNYGKALPSLKLDADNDRITTKTFSQPDNLYFWIKGQAVDATSYLVVDEYHSLDWHQVTSISNLPTTGTTEGPFALNNSTVQLRFTYDKNLGDLAFDDVRVTAHTPTPTPVGYKTPTPTPSPEGGEERKRTIPVTEPTEPPPTTPSAAPEPTAPPIEELLLADPGDYDGDGTADVAVFRPAPSDGEPDTGLWVIRDLSRFYFGESDDLPVSGDYDGDGSTDVAVYRSGLWAIKDLSRAYLGTGGDVPVPGDYDGDCRADLAVFRPASGLWTIRGLSSLYFGLDSDQAIPGDYDGDGAADLAHLP